jgi:hypothetical protein
MKKPKDKGDYWPKRSGWNKLDRQIKSSRFVHNSSSPKKQELVDKKRSVALPSRNIQAGVNR